MKTVALITEYNPFHYGHLYHLKESIKKTQATHSIAIMSSSFMQRGEPALIDKWTRTKMAINNGVDLVIELPFVYACQSAELFASGAIKILDALKVVNFLSFGSEEGRLKNLNTLADILVKEPLAYKNRLRYYLNQGLSFPVSRSKAIEDYLKTKTNDISIYRQVLKRSNNILAIEYLKALKRIDSSIKPVTVKRIGASYKEEKLHSKFASATGIRNLLLSSNFKEVKNYLPKASYELLGEYRSQYGNYNSLENYRDIIKYILTLDPKEKLKNILDNEPGLENRIVEIGLLEHKIGDIVKNISTKRHPETRVQRILIHLLNELYEPDVKELLEYEPQYIRVLGFNNKGIELLREIKAKTNLDIITKFANYPRLNNPIINKFLSYEERATNLYFLGVNFDSPLRDMDYLTSPYINKKI